jgi:hypothetical protein
MAIVFIFNVLVARKAEIDSDYPGGLVQFRSDWLVRPIERWCEDEHLIAFSSMGSHFESVASRLKSCGIDILQTDESVLPAIVAACCPWLDWDIHDKIERKVGDDEVWIQEIPRFWLKGHEPGEVAVFGRHKCLP